MIVKHRVSMGSEQVNRRVLSHRELRDHVGLPGGGDATLSVYFSLTSDLPSCCFCFSIKLLSA